MRPAKVEKTKKTAVAVRGEIRPGGRTERVRKAVLSAVLARLKTDDLNFSFQDIASAAGVHVTTIYARWPERASLVMAAYEEHIKKLEVALGGDWEADIHAVGIALRDFLSDPVELAANKLLITPGNDAYREQMVRRFCAVVRILAAPLEAAKMRGLVKPCIDSTFVVQMIVSSLLTLITFTGQIPDDIYVQRLVDHLIAACRA